jgi:hypothetical protein
MFSNSYYRTLSDRSTATAIFGKDMFSNSYCHTLLARSFATAIFGKGMFSNSYYRTLSDRSTATAIFGKDMFSNSYCRCALLCYRSLGSFGFASADSWFQTEFDGLTLESGDLTSASKGSCGALVQAACATGDSGSVVCQFVLNGMLHDSPAGPQRTTMLPKTAAQQPASLRFRIASLVPRRTCGDGIVLYQHPPLCCWFDRFVGALHSTGT